MNPNFIINFWPYWIAGLIVFPLLAALPQLKNIRTAIDIGQHQPNEVAKMFLNPQSLVVSIVFGLAAFVCFVLFLASVVVGTIAAIHNIFV